MKEIKLLLNNIIEGIQDKKGKKISKINLTGIPGAICDYFVICEGNTPSHVASIAESIEVMVKRNTGEHPIRVQGHQAAEWIGIDYGDIIVHVFLPNLREYYNIDNLWDDAPVEIIPSID
ncbi:MAG: ribosome silencing factor [Proteiniphilum sp.]|nr:ribosome silencing factor [Proteiniphilum sp.]